MAWYSICGAAVAVNIHEFTITIWGWRYTVSEHEVPIPNFAIPGLGDEISKKSLEHFDPEWQAKGWSRGQKIRAYGTTAII